MSSQLIKQSLSGASASAVLCPNNLQVAGDQSVAGGLSVSGDVVVNGYIQGLNNTREDVYPALGGAPNPTNITYAGTPLIAVTPLNTGVAHYVNIFLPADFLTNNEKYAVTVIATVLIANNNQLLNLNMYAAGATPANPGTPIIAYGGVQGTGSTMLTLTFYSLGVDNVVNATGGATLPYGILSAYTTSSSVAFA